MSTIAVLGIGNILMKDDGAGVEVVKRLEKMSWPDNVMFIDGGTAILSLLDIFINHKKIIVVDTLKGGHEAGTIYRLTPQQLGSWKKEKMSLHDAQVLDVLGMAALFNSHPDVIIYGIEPYSIDLDLCLSKEMLDRIPVLLTGVKNELEALLSQAGWQQTEKVIMHEVSLMQNVFELIDDYSREHQLSKVTKVVLRIGEMSCVSYDSLEFAFSVISKTTIAEDAELLIEQVDGRSQCMVCSHIFASSLLTAICPLCNKPAMCVAGRELHLQSLEGTKEES